MTTSQKQPIVLQTAKKHFDEDIERAKSILLHAATLPSGLLRDDLYRASWMFGVGALDAFFSDAFCDLTARTLRAMQKEPKIIVPDRLQNLKIPVAAVMRPKPDDGWRWRMVARELIENDSVLSIEEIRKLFNQFFNKNNKDKLLTRDRVESWIKSPKSNSRLFGITRAQFLAIQPSAKNGTVDSAIEHLEERFEAIFQRRHDCIHNCDRPKVKPQNVGTSGSIQNVLSDINFLVDHCHDALVAQYPEYLKKLGFSAITRNNVGASK